MRSDQGGEYTSRAWRDFVTSNGIRMEYASAYTPEQNGVSESSIKHINRAGRTILNKSLLSPSFWAEANHYSQQVKKKVITFS